MAAKGTGESLCRNVGTTELRRCDEPYDCNGLGSGIAVVDTADKDGGSTTAKPADGTSGVYYDSLCHKLKVDGQFGPEGELPGVTL